MIRARRMVPGTTAMIRNKRSVATLKKYARRTLAAKGQNQSNPLRYISPHVFYETTFNMVYGFIDRPIVLLCPWLGANQKDVWSFSNYYLKIGFDVVQIAMSMGELTLPKIAQKIAVEVLHFVNSPIYCTRPILFHGFSAGTHIYAEVLFKILNHPDERFITVGPRICGQILDHPLISDNITSEDVTSDASSSKDEDKAGNDKNHKAITSYMDMTNPLSHKRYSIACSTLKDNQFKTPTLLIHSKVDTTDLDYPQKIKELAEYWAMEDVEVYVQCFAGSANIEKLHDRPDLYLRSLDFFLNKMGLCIFHKGKSFKTLPPPNLKKAKKPKPEVYVSPSSSETGIKSKTPDKPVKKESRDCVKESSDCVKESSDCVKESSDCLKESSDCVKESSDCVHKSSGSVKKESSVTSKDSKGKAQSVDASNKRLEKAPTKSATVPPGPTANEASTSSSSKSKPRKKKKKRSRRH